MILFGLCKKTDIKIQKNYKDWIKYTQSIALKVGPFTFTALEIQHAILRAAMGLPKDFDSISDIEYPFYTVKNPKSAFKYPKIEPVINFGFYSPYKSSPSLIVYSSWNVISELKQNAEKSFSDIKFGSNIKKLKFPAVIETYEEDFCSGVSITKFKECIAKCLSTDFFQNHKHVFDSLYSIF